MDDCLNCVSVYEDSLPELHTQVSHVETRVYTFRTYLKQPVKNRVIRRHGAKSTTRPPVRTKLSRDGVLLDVERLSKVGDVLRFHLRLYVRVKVKGMNDLASLCRSALQNPTCP